MTQAETVTFETILVPARETPKAFMVFGGSYLPKSQDSVSPKREAFAAETVEVTMPKWLANR